MMKGKMRQLKLMLLLCMLGMILIPTSEVTAATALKKSDFISRMDEKKFDFYKHSNKKDDYGNKMEWACYVTYEIKESTDYCKGDAKEFVASRGIKFGNKASKVMKKFGKTSAVKCKQKEKLYKYVKYNMAVVDTSEWDSYLEYTYKQGKNKYQIRFYMNKKNRLVAVAYIKNLKKFYNEPNKQAKSGLSFVAPEGKTITTKTIGGKKVYILPKGTTFAFDESKINYEYYDGSVEQYDVYGQMRAYTGLNGPFVEDETIDDWIVQCYVEKTGKPLKMNKLGKYRYFTMCFHAYDKNDKKLAPEIFYFRISN